WYYLFYSGGLCCSQPCTYATGVARSRDLLGPYAKSPAGPLLVSGARWLCPGGGSILDRGRAGAPLLFFQAYARGDPARARQVLVAAIRFDAAGWPYVPGRVAPARVRAR
ncbi:MAG TPA: family 43 glycosylhydrolase, partial [Solirubrobacteraceae bacterium]|nr:family 43 glycosylhydrolase [Solirubrobacteraceae bacterium]